MHYNNKKKGVSMFNYAVFEIVKDDLNVKTKKVDVTYYRMHYTDLIASLFTKDARERIYFTDDNNKSLYYLMNGKKVVVPFLYRKELFSKCMLALYPIGAVISDKNNVNACGEVAYYEMENNVYIVKNNNDKHLRIHFDNAIIRDYYYFISSTGNVQRDFVGRDANVERFRKATNNYFENKEEADKKMRELFASLE